MTTPDESSGPRSRLRIESSKGPIWEAQQRLRVLQELILDQARIAAQAGDFDRFDKLISRFPEYAEHVKPPESTEDQTSEVLSPHEVTMDRRRVWIAILLIGVLFAVIGFAIFAPGTQASNAATYVSLVSGLAGIALGWLFGSSSASARAGLSKVRSLPTRRAKKAEAKSSTTSR